MALLLHKLDNDYCQNIGCGLRVCSSPEPEFLIEIFQSEGGARRQQLQTTRDGLGNVRVRWNLMEFV